MAAKGTFYLGRVVKLGNLDSEKLIEGIRKPRVIYRGNNGWSIIHQYESRIDGKFFIYAKLCKFVQQEQIEKFNRAVNEPEQTLQEDAIKARSPFVYFPDFSGIAFMRIPNHIEIHNFQEKFCSIIKEKYDNFFVDCMVELITDLRSFAAKISELSIIKEIHARINPPNPLFGIAWKSLNDYIKRRDSAEIVIEEKGKEGGLKTRIPDIVNSMVNKEILKPVPTVPQETDMTDAAILMAADGYGDGTIKGTKEGTDVTIRTSTTNKNFDFDKEAIPEQLAKKALELFTNISEERGMQH